MLCSDVLIVDDDPHFCRLLQKILNDDFNLHFTDNGEDALESIQTNHYKFVLLDLHIPRMSGLEVCRQCKTLPVSQKPSIIMMSADSNAITVKEAYELGVDDYIAKPINNVSFKARLMRIASDIEKIEQRGIADSEAQTVAEAAMAQAANYGNALELINSLANCHNTEAIAVHILENLMAQGYHAAIQLRNGKKLYSYDSDTFDCSSVKLQLFNLLKDHGRIFYFGKRCIFNAEDVSIIIKNMPRSGTRSYDMLVDTLAKIVVSANMRFHAQLNQQNLEAALNNIKLLTDKMLTNHSETTEMMSNIENKIGLSFHHLDMDESQEQYFMEIIEKEIKSRDNEGQIKDMQNILQDCIGSIQHRFTRDTIPTTRTGSRGDIELF